MANADGRYQSRLFKFVHKQSRRFTSYADRAGRYIQHTASWVAAFGMYPLMLLFGSRRTLAQQIHQAVQKQTLLLSAPESDSQHSVDTPIQTVLLSIDALLSESAISSDPKKPQPLKNIFAFPWGLNLKLAPSRFDKKLSQLEESGISKGKLGSGTEGESGEFLIQNHATCYNGADTSLNAGSPRTGDVLGIRSNAVAPKSKIQNRLTPHSPLTPQTVIQGIATQLTSRTLVLVTADNQILDILTSTQQEKLQLQIITAVADYWRYQTEQGEKILQESKGEKPLPFSLPTVLAFLDRTVAKVETNHLVQVKEAERVPCLSKGDTRGARQLVEQIQTGSGAISQGKSAINSNGSSTTDTIRIVALIRAAIDYFFGIGGKSIDQTTPKSDNPRLNPNLTESGSALKPSLKSTNSQAQPLRLKGRYQAAKLSSQSSYKAYLPLGKQSVNPGIENPWLCESDLFGEWVTSEKLTGQAKQSSYKTPMSGSRLRHSTKFSLHSLADSLRKLLTQPKPASEIVKQQKINRIVVSIDSTSHSALFKSPEQDTSTEFTSSNSNTDIQPAPDWIETNATVMGYVKHPLEQLLAWLDQIMLWLEEVLLRIWHWLQKIGARG